MNKYLHYTLLLFILPWNSHAQRYPVQSTVQLVPPYSLSLDSYTAPGSDQLRLTLLLLDLEQPTYDVRLRFVLEGTGIRIETSPAYNPPPLTLEAGAPTLLSGPDLSNYLDVRNLVFSGITRQEYERRGVLPEGFYRFSFIVEDYRRPGVPLARESSTQAWLALGEPPLLNTPFCGSEVTFPEGQQNFIFQWSPIGTSPNAALDTEYELTLVEIRPAGRNPFDALNTTIPLYQVTTGLTSVVYGITEPPLIPGLEYAWRVQARDITGLDRFKNNGYSRVCTFRVPVNAVELDAPGGLTAEGETERSARVTWRPVEEGNGYRVEYREADNPTAEWFGQDVFSQEGELVITNLRPGTEYEVQVGTIRERYARSWSEKVRFRTLAPRVMACGDPTTMEAPTNTRPLTTAMVGDIFQVGQFEMVITSIRGGDGRFNGTGAVLVPYLGFRVNSTFTDLRVNENKEVIDGEVIALSEGIDGLVDRWEEGEESPGDGEGDTVGADAPGEDEDIFEGEEIAHEGEIDSVYLNGDGQIVVVDEGGEETVYEQGVDEETGEPVATRVVGEDGEEWVVDSEGNVTKGSQGGVSDVPGGTAETDSVLFVQKELIKEVLQYFKEEINLWLENNGKGPLDEALVRRLMALPDCLPEDEEGLEELLERITYFEENPKELIELIKANTENQDRFDFLVNKLNAEQPPYREGLTEAEWDELLIMVCPHLLPEEEPIVIEGLSRNADLVSINTISSSFKPEEERLELTYTLKDTLGLANSKLEIFKLDENDEELVTFYSNIKKGKQIEFADSQDGDKKGWSGKGSDGEFIKAGQYKIKLTATIDESFSNGYEDYEQFEVLTKDAGDEIYDYFVTDNDAWYREKEAPYKTITPEPRTNILAKGTQVAVLEIAQDDKGKDVAKMKLKSNGGVEYTSLSNLTQVKSFSKERKYRLLKEYEALKIPFPGNNSDKTYKKDVEITVNKHFGNYLKVTGYDYWIEKSVVIWIDAISTGKIISETQNATKVGTKYTGNETSVACNICVRSALLLLKEDQVLFPVVGSAYYDPADGFKVSYIKGSITNPGRAKNIKEDFDVISSKLDLNARFTEVEKKDDEDWEAYFKRLQDKADAGGIVIGAMLSSGGSSGHVMMITPGGLVDIDLDDPNEHVSKWGESFTSRNILKVPRVLECGTGVREAAAPLCRNVDRRGALERLKWFEYNN